MDKPKSNPIVPILGLNTDVQCFDKAIQTLLGWAKDRDERRYICFAAVYALTRAYQDAGLQEIFNQSDMIPADGMPLVWIQRRRGFPYAERVYAPDVMQALCQQSVGQQVSHYLWGGEPDVTSKLVENLSRWYPGIQIAGYHSPPFRELENQADTDVINQINSANPSIVWVCLGSVKQERWMSLYRPHLDAPLLLGVGASFAFLAGTTPQAPKWMQRNGLEWLFRLLTEPRRLARRYLIYNPLFLFYMIREAFYLRYKAEE